MIKVKALRSLLLEQLESRCMLAGSIFAQTIDPHEPPRQARSGIAAVTPNHSEVGKHDHGPRPRGEHSHFGTPRYGRQPDSSQAESQPLLSLTGILFELRALPTQSESLNQSRSDVTRTPDNQELTPVLSRPIAESTQPGISTLQPATLQPTMIDGNAAQDATVKTPSIETVAVTNEAADSNTLRSSNLRRAVSSLPGTKISQPAITSRSSDSARLSESDLPTVGGIDLLPSLRRELHPRIEDDDEPWHVDPRSLDGLREVARDLTSDYQSSRAKNTDAAIASWFGSSTGLIEVQATGQLPTSIELTDSVVDVVLDATVGLHRSIGLIAADSDSEATTNGVRRAILAAIAAEQAVELSETRTHAPPKISAIACPGAALLVTGIAMAARRRRKETRECPRCKGISSGHR